MYPLKIVLAALLTGLVSLCIGLVLLQRLRIRLTRQEQYLYAYVAGSACLSMAVFATAAAGLVYQWTFGVIAIAAISTCAYLNAYSRPPDSLAALPAFWRWLLIAIMVPYGLLYFVYALAPEVSPDGMAYHLGLVSKYFQGHGFGRVTTNMYANLPMGMEMLYLYAFAFGRHSAAALVHWQFLVVLPLLLMTIGLRFKAPAAGVVAALLVFCSPVIGLDGSTAYIDVGMACVLVALFGLLQIWDERGGRSLLWIIGLLAGFSYACKLTAFLAVPYAVLFVFYRAWRTNRQPWRSAFVTGIVATAVIAPWLIKNAVVVGNPFSPFLNKYFSNPYIRISFEEIYVESHRSYAGLKSYWDIPMEAAVRGGVLQGLAGPMFLLAPIALFAMRSQLGRRALFAAGLFALTYRNNVGTRFLIAALPFLSLALGLVLTRWRVAALVVIFHAVISWPDVVRLYSDQYAWRIDKLRWRPALRLESEHDFLWHMTGGYRAAKLAEEHVPENGKILTFGGIAEAYCRREILVAYQAGFNNLLGDILATAIVRPYQPGQSWTFQIPTGNYKKVRVVQTGVSKDTWKISEFRVLGPAGELLRQSSWRISSIPNPWEVQLAFDNCPVTRWNAWERAKPGMFMEVDFGSDTNVAGVQLMMPLDQSGTSARLEAPDGRGGWKVLVEAPKIEETGSSVGLRREAMIDLKRFGITHISVNDSEFFADDFAQNAEAWGVKLLGEAGGNRLYGID